ncbi:hypothetical protein ABZ816_34120 [Actinosynnema sp. NPDC047251]|uniref:Putative membrane protein n=1 Tax=Saccharothrix espanaensis (strain ATCC 51144 / DSM 44229 / JCM 9112 / NBRC 15066 / NRRL 15764) TaxID=1179773 RepID=K0K1P3_SACES|nr:hypothetical protein [Saccharothrix espanaensis]CCH32261.1 putative membrane protein [Saccharothrix espanaensis DSM 44229]
MLKEFVASGPGHLRAGVAALPLGGRADEGVDHQVVDWAMGGLPDESARQVEARVHTWLEEAARIGRDLAWRQGVLWLAGGGALLVLSLIIALR